MIPPSWRPTNAAYHRSAGWSSTAIRLFARSPALFRRRYIDHVVEPETSAMAIGSAVGWIIQDAAGEALESASRTTCLTTSRLGSGARRPIRALPRNAP